MLQLQKSKLPETLDFAPAIWLIIATMLQLRRTVDDWADDHGQAAPSLTLSADRFCPHIQLQPVVNDVITQFGSDFGLQTLDPV